MPGTKCDRFDSGAMSPPVFLASFQRGRIAVSRTSVSVPYHIGCVKQTSHIIISAGSKLVPISTPRQPTDLLRVDHNSSEQSDRCMSRCWGLTFAEFAPLNTIIVYVSKLVANQKLLTFDHNWGFLGVEWTPTRLRTKVWAARDHRLPCKACNSSVM